MNLKKYTFIYVPFLMLAVSGVVFWLNRRSEVAFSQSTFDAWVEMELVERNRFLLNNPTVLATEEEKADFKKILMAELNHSENGERLHRIFGLLYRISWEEGLEFTDDDWGIIEKAVGSHPEISSGIRPYYVISEADGRKIIRISSHPVTYAED